MALDCTLKPRNSTSLNRQGDYWLFKASNRFEDKKERRPVGKMSTESETEPANDTEQVVAVSGRISHSQ